MPPTNRIVSDTPPPVNTTCPKINNEQVAQTPVQLLRDQIRKSIWLGVLKDRRELKNLTVDEIRNRTSAARKKFAPTPHEQRLIELHDLAIQGGFQTTYVGQMYQDSETMLKAASLIEDLRDSSGLDVLAHHIKCRQEDKIRSEKAKVRRLTRS